MEIKTYKGYDYIVDNDGNIYFDGSYYRSGAYKNLERSIKTKISKIDSEYNLYNDYYKSKEYCNKLVKEVLSKGGILNE